MAEGYSYAYSNPIYEDLNNDGKAVVEGVEGRHISNADTFSLTDVQIGIPWAVLRSFDIENYLQSNNIHVVKINEFMSDGLFQCKTKTLQDVTNIFQDFARTSMYSRPVTFECVSALKLLMKNNEINENVFLYLEKLCRQHKTQVYQCMITGKVCVCGKTKTCVEKAQPVLAQSIVKIALQRAELEKIQSYIERWASKNKLVKLAEDDYAVVFLVTSDVMEDFNETVINDHFFKLPSLESETLSKNKKSYTKLMDLAKKLNVTIVQHDKHTELLHLNGTKNGVQRLIKELQKIFCVHEVKVPLPVSPLKVYEIEQSLTQIADDSNFCVEISLPRKDRTGGSLIATWFNSDARQIHVVQGNLLELKVDTILILTTECLFPVAKLQTQENVKPAVTLWKKYAYTWGKAVFSENIPTRCLLPIYENNKSGNSIRNLNAAFQDAFSKITAKQFKTVAFHSDVMEEVQHCFPLFLSEFISASMTYPVEIFICCSPDKDVSAVVKTINDCCLCARQGTFKMTINTYLEGFRQINVAVLPGALAFAKADVLVNTTDAHLTFSSGIISKQILKHAGTGILDECKEKYPSGIKEGSFAVTSSGKLAEQTKARYIFHCVLPPFEKEKFDQVIQDMVKQILVEADQRKCASIALPPIGTGSLEYPVRETIYAMLEATYEYTTSAICSCIETILFIIYVAADSKTVEQFIEIHNDIKQERKRRLKYDLRLTSFPGVYKEVYTGMLTSLLTKAVIHITSSCVMKYIPLSDVVFSVSTGTAYEVHLERGECSNIAWKYFKTKDAIDECLKATVTDVAFVYGNGNPNILKQECVAVAEHVSSVIENTKYLRRITILLPDALLKETVDKLLATNSYLPGFSKWTLIKSTDLDVAYRVCYMEEKDIHKVEQYASFVKPGLGSGPDYNIDEYDVIQHVETTEYQHEEVTAVINTAIIKYLEDNCDLLHWISAVQNTFKLRVSSDKTNFNVSGALQDIELFETYLMSDFPNFPHAGLPKMNSENPCKIEKQINYSEF